MVRSKIIQCKQGNNIYYIVKVKTSIFQIFWRIVHYYGKNSYNLFLSKISNSSRIKNYEDAVGVVESINRKYYPKNTRERVVNYNGRDLRDRYKELEK